MTETPASNAIKSKDSFAGDVLKLVSGTTLAQGVLVLATPFLTRLYTPEAFGLYTLLLSITGIAKVIAGLRYEQAIVLPKADEEAVNVLGVSLTFTTILSLLMLLLGIGLNRSMLLELLNVSELRSYLWIIPVVVLLGGIFQALNYWNTRTRNFGRLSIAQTVNSVGIIATQLGFGYAGNVTGGGLIGATAIGSFMSTMVLGWQIWRDDHRLFRQALKWKDMLQQLKRYRKFPLYDAWATLLNTISWQLPSFILAYFFSQAEVGYYALSFRLFKLPMSLIGSAIAQVFLQRAAEAKLNNKLTRLVEDNFRRLVILGLFPSLLLTFIGRDLFVMILGANWSEAGVYTQIMSVWLFFWFISSPLSSLFRVLEKQEFGLYLNIAIFVTRFLSLAIGGILRDARLAIALFAVSGILVYGYLNISIVNSAGVKWSRVGQILFSNFLVFIPVGLIFLGLNTLSVHHWIRIGVAVVILGLYLLYHGLTTFQGEKYVRQVALRLRNVFGK